MSTVGIRNRLDPCLDEALQRWVGEGGADTDNDLSLRTTSIEHIDTNATQEASDAQSSADAEDRAAKSPADLGGQG
jgi:hypothetical protein